jgi:hypothetical protein
MVMQVLLIHAEGLKVNNIKLSAQKLVPFYGQVGAFKKYYS